MTDAQDIKVQLFPDKTPTQVTGFTKAAVTYNRGQDAYMIKSTSTN
jgi:hypothetical protein